MPCRQFPGRRVQAFDDAADQLVDRLRGHGVADRVFYGASALGEHGMVWVMLACVRGLRGQRHWRAALRGIVGVGVESVIVNGGIKSLFRRSRPVVEVVRPLPLRIPMTSSFPSGHASSAFFSARLLSDGDPALAPFYYGLAVLVATSRIYVKIHHATDVLAGAAVGATLGSIARRVVPLEPHPR